MSTSNQDNSLPQEGFVRLEKILTLLSMSRTAFLAGVKEGRFPKPVKITPRTSRWKVTDIRELIDKINKGEF